MKELRESQDNTIIYMCVFIQGIYKGIYPISTTKYDDYEVIESYINGNKLKVNLKEEK